MTLSTEAGRALARLRDRAPLVHNITNYVSMDVAANVLLAAGASPVMAHAIEEVEAFVEMSGALVVNIGTLSEAWVRAMHRAASRAAAIGTPWVLDPVGVGATAYRTTVAGELARHRPTVVRGNASEILALAGEAGETKGVDSTKGVDAAREVAAALARRLGCVVAATGKVDFVTDGTRARTVANGDPLMTKVTALGCSASALVGAFLAVTPDPLEATAQALAFVGLAGEIGARGAAGPGSFRVAFMDALQTIDAAVMEDGARIAEA
ncbi:MAG TPA: hydroxyethylthiazole kinase [Gemmatimonadaceae bacterium]